MKTQELISQELTKPTLPFLHLPDIETSFDNIMRQFLNGGLGEWRWVPHAEIYNDEEDVILNVDVPGVHPDDIDIEVSGDKLIISAQRLADEKNAGDVVLSDIRYGSIRRSFVLGFELDLDNAEAELSDGVLKITMKNVLFSPVRKKIPISYERELV